MPTTASTRTPVHDLLHREPFRGAPGQAGLQSYHQPERPAASLSAVASLLQGVASLDQFLLMTAALRELERERPGFELAGGAEIRQWNEGIVLGSCRWPEYDVAGSNPREVLLRFHHGISGYRRSLLLELGLLP